MRSARFESIGNSLRSRFFFFGTRFMLAQFDSALPAVGLSAFFSSNAMRSVRAYTNKNIWEQAYR